MPSAEKQFAPEEYGIIVLPKAERLAVKRAPDSARSLDIKPREQRLINYFPIIHFASKVRINSSILCISAFKMLNSCCKRRAYRNQIVSSLSRAGFERRELAFGQKSTRIPFQVPQPHSAEKLRFSILVRMWFFLSFFLLTRMWSIMI